MIFTLIYDAKDPQKRKEILRGNIFILVVLFCILLVLSLLSSFLVLGLASSQDDQLQVAISCFFHLVFMSVVFVLFLALLILPTAGSQTVHVQFFDTHFTVISNAPFGRKITDISYQDVEKVYISKLSKFRIWQKCVGHYSIYYKVYKEKCDGVSQNHKKPSYRQFPIVNTLQEAEAIVDYINNKKIRDAL